MMPQMDVESLLLLLQAKVDRVIDDVRTCLCID